LQEFGDYCAERIYQSEQLDERDHFNEYIMTSLRCAEGLDLEHIEQRFGKVFCETLLVRADAWLASGDLVAEGGRLRIPAERFLVSDAVIEGFFEV
jgi:oxygen-independent coproporphyrinogen-3 oxidase